MDSADEVHQKLAVRADGLSRFFLAVAALAVAGALLLAAFGYAAKNARVKQWNPLGVWAVQKVLNGPVIHVGGTVDVRATKCAKETVNAHGSNEWQQVSGLPGAAGAIVAGTQGIGMQVKGCHTFVYRNAIPPAVQLLVQRDGPSQWVITGQSVPFRNSGEQGQPRTWTTTEFTVAP